MNQDNEHENEYLGWGGELSEEENEDLNQAIQAKHSGDMKLGKLDTTFRRVRSKLWQPPRGLVHDDAGAGPNNMPPKVRGFSPLKIFMLFFPLYLVKAIVAQTNLYYCQRDPGTPHLAPFLTVREFFTFVALHLKMLKSWCGRQNKYFSSRGPFDARRYMSRRRFFWIKAHLHFADKSKRPQEDDPTWDPLYLIRPLVKTFNVLFRKYWKLSRMVSLDEMMVSFRGRNPFHRFIPRKPHPNGFKLHAICCAKRYFCVAFLVDDNIKRTIPQIAAELFRDNVVAGMTVITDRWYTCTGLVQLCLGAKVGLIGSTKTQRFLAKHVLTGWSGNEGAKKERGSFAVAKNKDGKVACVVWKDKGVVRFTVTASSTMRVKVRRKQKNHDSFLVDAPYCAEVYDQYFHGVDRNDQLRGDGYGLALCFRATKYTVKFFLGMLDVVLSNTWILWRNLHTKDAKKHADWFDSLTEEMLNFNPLDEPLYQQPQSPESERHAVVNLAMVPTKIGGQRRMLGDCAVCSAPGKRKRTSFGCAICNIAVCAHQCHAHWHTSPPLARKLIKSRFKKLRFDVSPSSSSSSV